MGKATAKINIDSLLSCSESTNNHHFKTPSTHQNSCKHAQSLSGLQAANASTYLSYALSNRRVHNLSASELAKAAQRRSPAATSFSRGLSKHPVHVLKSQQKELLGFQYLMNQKNEIEHQGFDGDVSSTLIKHQLDSLPLHASGHMSCFHARQASHPKQHCPAPSLNLQMHPSKTSTHEIRISVPHETSLGIRPSPRTVTLTFDPESHHFSPHRTIEPKPSRRLTRVLKSQRFSSPRFFCEESASCDKIQLVAHGAMQPSGSKTDNSQFTALNHPPSLSLLRLTSQSPDYMSVSAKFSGGHLILTDREGLVTQHLHTETESETNLNPRSPSRGAEVEGDSSGSGKSADTSTLNSREDLKDVVPDLNEREGLLTSKEESVSVQADLKVEVPAGSRAPPPSATVEVIRKDSI